jgi:[ribosomal protein S5]-alanine N-acetyltransferase
MWVRVLAGMARTEQLARVGPAFLEELCIAVAASYPTRARCAVSEPPSVSARDPDRASPVIRRLVASDAAELAALRSANRAYLEQWDPDWDDPERLYSVKGVRAWITDGNHRFAILEGDEIAGMVSLTGIIRGSMQTCMVGYFVDKKRAGRGLATRAVGDVVAVAFGELQLHRVEAGTAVENIASQKVLEHNGFTLVGLMREHLQIRGAWVDHLLWETLADDE